MNNDRHNTYLINGFYLTVLSVALVGQVTGATSHLGWHLLAAIPAVGALELGGVALAAYADSRRRIGERAYSARTLSAAVASFAVGFNWVCHTDRILGAFFAGMSALGYLVYLLHSGARRRDALRAAGNLSGIAPAYGMVQWLRHPGITRRARALALADPSLGLRGSLRAVVDEDLIAAQTAAIAELLRRKLAQDKGDLEAQIATTVYDIPRIARRLAETADYDGLTAILAADLVPAKVAGPVEPTPVGLAPVVELLPVPEPLPLPVVPPARRAPHVVRQPGRRSAAQRLADGWPTPLAAANN